MIAYVESSVILRLVLGQAGALREWRTLDAGATSALAEVECLRTLDRLMRVGSLTAEELAERRTAVYRLLEAVEVVDVARPVLGRAAEPFPTPLGTLDAIHLSTALIWRDARNLSPVMATHDKALATGARSVWLEVIGV